MWIYNYDPDRLAAYQALLDQPADPLLKLGRSAPLRPLTPEERILRLKELAVAHQMRRELARDGDL